MQKTGCVVPLICLEYRCDFANEVKCNYENCLKIGSIFVAISRWVLGLPQAWKAVCDYKSNT